MAKLTAEERAELEAKLKADDDDDDSDTEDFGEIAILRGPGVKKFLAGLLGEPAKEKEKDSPPVKDSKPPTTHKFFKV